MRPDRDVTQVLGLVASGLGDAEICRRTGVPRSTVRGWRLQTQRVSGRRRDYDRDDLPAPDYAYLLGLYLGDGHVSRGCRAVHRFRIFLDERHSNILMWCIDAIRRVLPSNRVGVHFQTGCAVVSSYSRHWPALLPQHGAGKKHERAITLADWQEAIVVAHPQPFVRGLIHSDGSRFANRVRHGGRTYVYTRYTFTNESADIRALFTAACDRIGVEWRQMNATNVSVARRASVAKLDALVGPKR